MYTPYPVFPTLNILHYLGTFIMTKEATLTHYY